MTQHSSRDKALGMDRAISRRDFLNGVALTAGALSAGALGGMGFSGSPARAEGTAYPPGLTGLRGHNPNSFSVMHAVRDGTFWDKAGAFARNLRR